MRIRYWITAQVYIFTWRYGVQFDVQRSMRWDAKGYCSFKGGLYAWDYRHPLSITRQD